MPKDISKPISECQMLSKVKAGAQGSTFKGTIAASSIKSRMALRKRAAGSNSGVADTTGVCNNSGGLATPTAMPESESMIHIDSLERETMGETWFNVLKPEFTKPYFRKLKQFLAQEQKSYTIYPALNNVYSWSRLTPLDSVKVVVLGQDPYHDVGQAHGLSFSVLPPTKPPPSLKNIYKQISTDFPSFVIPISGDLTPLAKLGILWLNTSLTVRAHKAASHFSQGWETFTAEVIRAVIARESEKGVVFMAWGLPAQKTCDKIGIDEGKHLVLRSAHPSPLSARRGFLGNGHFRKANEWLCEKHGHGSGIDWTKLGT